MILIDTSVWVEFFRKKGDPGIKDSVEDLISSRESAISGPIVFEIIAGAREKETKIIQQVFSFCEFRTFESVTWFQAGTLYNKLRKKGKTVPKSDILIAAVSLESKLPLLCRDHHFEIIRDFGDNRLVVHSI